MTLLSQRIIRQIVSLGRRNPREFMHVVYQQLTVLPENEYTALLAKVTEERAKNAEGS